MQLKTLAAVMAIFIPLRVARAQESERVDAHGFYYKETSTRVVTPHLDVLASVPQTGTTIGASYLLDAITSASIAQGVSSDKALTEYRNEVGFSVTQAVGPGRIGRVGASYLRSRESDYDSDTIAVSAAVDLFEKNTTWAATYAHSFDTVFNRSVGRMEPIDPSRGGPGLDTDYISLVVSQLLSPTTVGALGVEYAYLNGFQSNAYRQVAIGAAMPEKDPMIRNRYTYFGRIAQLLPLSMTTLQLQYRYYTDDWQLDAHTVEFRIYQDLTRNLDGRIAYRYHNQGHAFFAKLPTAPGGQAYTTDDIPRGYTSDPKLFAFSDHYIEFQLRLLLSGVREIPVVRWFEGGAVDLTVGFMYTGFDFEHAQPTFGNCGPTDPSHQCAERVIGLGVTLPL